jgi:hypothetical protein
MKNLRFQFWDIYILELSQSQFHTWM